MPTLNIVTILKICILLILPIMFLVIWLLPRLLNSKRHIKIIVCAGIISTFVLGTIFILSKVPPQIQNIKFVSITVTIFWGIIGWFIGVYYDVRLRVELGPKYYNEVMDFRAYAMKNAFVWLILSLPLGVFTGWIVVTFSFSLYGVTLGIFFGAIYGGILGRLLDSFTKGV